MTDDACAPEWATIEDAVREKTDQSGNIWRKVYFGGGSHFQSWLEQFREIYGEENVAVEEVEPTGMACYEREGEKAYRIWAKESK